MLERHKRWYRGGLLAALMLGAAGYGYAAWCRFADLRNNENPLVVRQVGANSVSSADEFVVQAKPGERHEFAFQLTNRSSNTLEGLQIKTCQCQVSSAPATRLEPGASTTMSLVLRAPRVGESRTRIPIVASGRQEGLAMIEVVIRVDLQPPVFHSTPADLQLEVIAGVPFTRDYLVETIEKQSSPQWVEGMEFKPANVVLAELRECREKALAGTNLVRRSYRFELKTSAESTTWRGTYQLRFAHTPAREEAPKLVTLDMHDPISVFPNPISVSSEKPARVIVVVRAGDCRVDVPEAPSGLTVTAAPVTSPGNTQTFHVATAEADMAGTQILKFRCRQGADVRFLEIPVTVSASGIVP